MHLIEQVLHFPLGFALQTVGHQRGGRLGDATTGPDEANVFDLFPIQRQIKFQLVSAKRVMPLGRTGRIAHFVEIARVLAMIEDDLLIEIV